MSDYGAAYGDQSYTVNRSDQAKKDEKKAKDLYNIDVSNFGGRRKRRKTRRRRRTLRKSRKRRRKSRKRRRKSRKRRTRRKGGNMFWETDKDRYIKAHNQRQRDRARRNTTLYRERAAAEKEQQRRDREAAAEQKRKDREARERNKRHEEKERRANEKRKARARARKEKRRPQQVSKCSSKSNMSDARGCGHYYYELDGNKYYCRNGPGGPDAMPPQDCSEKSATWGARKPYNP